MADKTKELIELINKYPDHKLIFLYPNEGSDDFYTLGYRNKILVDEYWVTDERVWLRYEDEDEIFDHYADYIFDELYPEAPYANNEQEKVIKEKTKEFIDSQNWKKCICVYIHY